MNMEFLLQELCKKVRRMDRKSFNNMIKRLSTAYEKSHKNTYDIENSVIIFDEEDDVD